MDLFTSLGKIGLSSYEIEAFVYLSKSPHSEAMDIHKNTKIPLGKIYSTLNSLEERGFICIKNLRPKLYSLNDLDYIFGKILLNKEREHKKNISFLNNYFEEIKRNITNREKKERTNENYWFEDQFTGNFGILSDILIKAKNNVSLFIQFPESDLNSYYLEQVSNVLDSLFDKGVELKIILNKENIKFLGLLEKKSYSNISFKCTDTNIQSPYILIDGEVCSFIILNQINDKIFGVVRVNDIYLNSKLTNHFESFWKKLE